MKVLFTLLFGWIFTHSSVYVQAPVSFYSLKMKTIDGKEFDFSTLRGKKVLIVNTASKCGFTSQYKKLEELHKRYGGEKFVVLGFPANNFGGQEPGSNEEITDFCSKNFQISFQMFEKSSVKGNNINPVYKWLTQKQMNGVSDTSVSWNFQKFMVDENGNWSGSVSSIQSPDCNRIVKWIKNNR